MRRHRQGPISNLRESRTRFSERGFTLVEIMVTVVVASLGIMGMSALFSDMIQIQKRAATMQMLASFRGAMISAITNRNAGVQGAWERSIADVDATTGNPEANHACLRTKTLCTKDVAAQFNLKSIDGSELFYSRTATRGFTYDGQLCNTFSIATPTSACPFRWTLTTTNRCVGTNKPSCSNPVVEVAGVLEYAPGTPDPLIGGLNPTRFQISVRRGEQTDKNEPVVISYIEGVAANDSSGEAGDCQAAWVARKFNTIVSDPASNVVSLTADSFTLRLGTYECRIQAPAFKNGGNTLHLSGGGVSLYSGVTSASLQGDSVNVTMQANFSLSSDTSLQLLHRCTNKPTDSAWGEQNVNFMLGVPVRSNNLGDYRDVTYSLVSCVKTSG